MSLHLRSTCCAIVITVWVVLFVSGLLCGAERMIWAMLGLGQVAGAFWLDYRSEARRQQRDRAEALASLSLVR